MRDKFLKWKEAFESKGLKVNLGITKVMVISGITKDDLPCSKVDQCGVSGLRAKANSVLCGLCDKWIQGRCRKYEGNIGDAVEQEEKLCE